MTTSIFSINIFLLSSGLHYQDCYQDSPVLTEALKRLPPDVMDARNNRILRATYLSLNKTYLPKEEWTKYEEDIKYLQPYLEEVEREFSEKKAYNDNNFETK